MMRIISPSRGNSNCRWTGNYRKGETEWSIRFNRGRKSNCAGEGKRTWVRLKKKQYGEISSRTKHNEARAMANAQIGVTRNDFLPLTCAETAELDVDERLHADRTRPLKHANRKALVVAQSVSANSKKKTREALVTFTVLHLPIPWLTQHSM